jgi:hypothetical protein
MKTEIELTEEGLRDDLIQVNDEKRVCLSCGSEFDTEYPLYKGVCGDCKYITRREAEDMAREIARDEIRKSFELIKALYQRGG